MSKTLVGAGAGDWHDAAIAAQGGTPAGQGQMRGGGMMHDAQHDADMAVFQALIDNRQKIQRTVIKVANGIETVTESDDPEVVKLIQTQVNAMYGRVKEARPIHVRDPLFKAIFENADKIVMKHEMTPKGINVVEPPRMPTPSSSSRRTPTCWTCSSRTDDPR